MELIKKTITEDGTKYEYYVDEQGRKQGECIARYSLGAVEVANYKDGKRHGKYVGFYPNGTKEDETNYENGELHGNYVKYNLDGSIQQKGQYHYGTKVGKWVTYYPEYNK